VKRLLIAAVAVASTSLLVTGCTKVLDGKAISTASNPFTVAGIPVTNGPSGLRPNASGPTRTIDNTDGGEIDHLAAMAISDVEQFWSGGGYTKPLKGTFTPVNAVFSWDSRFKHGEFCGKDTEGYVNARWCGNDDKNCPTSGSACTPSEDTIGFDRGEMLADERESFGDMAIPLVLAHEYGHGITFAMADLVDYDIDSALAAFVSEQQADCFAGVYMHWVAEGKSSRFTLSTGDGLTKVMSAMIDIRDPLLARSNPMQGALVHGSAFERVSAFQTGFTDGPAGCVGINVITAANRRAALPKDALERGATGEEPISRESVKSLVDSLTKLFSLGTPPKLSFDPPSCPDARPSPPASYCPSTNTIAIDLPGLIVMGTSLSRGSPVGVKGTALFGDYTAYSVVVSRFMLAVQHQKPNMSLDTVDAGQRTACLTGTATKKLYEGDGVQLAGGDLDEAVSGLLTNGLAASNVNGESAPSAFARVDAFRAGVVGDENVCYKRWP
jgi:predicted metalloprotease